MQWKKDKTVESKAHYITTGKKNLSAPDSLGA